MTTAYAPCDHKCGPNPLTLTHTTTYPIGWTTYEGASARCLRCNASLGRIERSLGTLVNGCWQDVPAKTKCVHPATFTILPGTIRFNQNAVQEETHPWDGQAECVRCLARWNMKARNGPRGPEAWIAKPVEAKPRQ